MDCRTKQTGTLKILQAKEQTSYIGHRRPSLTPGLRNVHNPRHQPERLDPLNSELKLISHGTQRSSRPSQILGAAEWSCLGHLVEWSLPTGHCPDCPLDPGMCRLRSQAPVLGVARVLLLPCRHGKVS